MKTRIYYQCETKSHYTGV